MNTVQSRIWSFIISSIVGLFGGVILLPIGLSVSLIVVFPLAMVLIGVLVIVSVHWTDRIFSQDNHSSRIRHALSIVGITALVLGILVAVLIILGWLKLPVILLAAICSVILTAAATYAARSYRSENPEVREDLIKSGSIVVAGIIIFFSGILINTLFV